jgi:hypothetical protein
MAATSKAATSRAATSRAATSRAATSRAATSKAAESLQLRFSSSCTIPTVLESGAAKGILNAAILSAAGNFVQSSMYADLPSGSPDIANDFFLYLKLEIKRTGAIGAVMNAIAQSVISSGRDIVVGELEGKAVGQQFIDAYGEGYLIFIFYEGSSVQFDNLQELSSVDVQQTFRAYMRTPGPVLTPPCFTQPATTKAATTKAATTRPATTRPATTPAATDPCTVYLANGSTINACDQEVYIKSRTYDGIGYPRMVDYGVLYRGEQRSENSIRALSVKPCDFDACRWKLQKRTNGNVAILNKDGDTLKVFYEGGGPITQVTTQPDRSDSSPEDVCQEFTLRYSDDDQDRGYTISIPDGYPHAGVQIGLEPGATADGDPDDPGGVPVVYAVIENQNFPNTWEFESVGTPATTTRPATTRPATTRPATTRPATTRPATTRPATTPVKKLATVFYSECNRVIADILDRIALVDEGIANASLNYKHATYEGKAPRPGDNILVLKPSILKDPVALNNLYLAVEAAARNAGVDPRIVITLYASLQTGESDSLFIEFYPKSKLSISISVPVDDADYIGKRWIQSTTVMELFDGTGNQNTISPQCEPRTSLVKLVRGRSVPVFAARSTDIRQWPVPQLINGGLRFSGFGTSTGNWLEFPANTIDMNKGFTFVVAFRFARSTAWQRVFDFGAGQANKNILLTQKEDQAVLRFGIFDSSGAESACEVPIEFGKVLVAWGWYDHTLPGMTLRVDNAGVVQTGRLFPPKMVDKRALTSNFVGKSNWDFDSYSNMDLFHLRMFNEFINEDNPRQAQLIQYAKAEAAAISAGMAEQAPPTSAPTQPPVTQPPVTQPPPNVSPQACEISLQVDGQVTLVYANVCSIDKTYQFWSVSAGSVLRYNTQTQDIVVAPSYDPKKPATDSFRFYSPSVGSPVLIKNQATDTIFGENYVYADTLDGDFLWGGGTPQSDEIILRFYVRQLPGRARKPRYESVGAGDSPDIARIAIEADVNSCFSDGCISAKGNGKRYFVAVQDGRARVLGTTATNDNLPDNFVFYVAENFRNYYDNIEGTPPGAACSIL